MTDALTAIGSCGVVAIIRGPFLAGIEEIVGALIAGGVRVIEISLTSPDALAQIERAAACAGTRASVGAGTVLRGEEVEDVALRFTNVWIRRDGRWQMVAWQSTRIPG